jgi:hypothetical protein
MLKTMIRFLAMLAVLSVPVACAVPQHHVPRYYDTNNPLKRVAVLPMRNDTADVDGPDVVRKKMIGALEEKSYIVKDVKESDQILRDQMGVNLGGQLDMTTPQKLGEVLGVDGVLYGTLMDFDETNTGVLDVRKVRATFKLVNTMTGQVFWERGLGVRTETRMPGRTGDVTTAIARGADAKEKDVPWVTINSVSTRERNVGQAFAMGLSAKLLTKAIGIHLEYESNELVRRVTDNLPWGPGPGAAATVAAPKYTGPKIKIPEPPSFGYIDYGKKDFAAILVCVSVDKISRDTRNFQIPLAKGGEKLRMDMDLSRMSKGGEGMPPALSTVTTIHRGDKKVSYTLYPNSQKYMVLTHPEGNGAAYEKPHVEKTRVGSETVDNHPTDKYRVKITYKDGKVEEGFVWNACDLDEMTIKSEVENTELRLTTELKNIVLRTPAASLFEIPDGYTEAQGFMDLMMGTEQCKEQIKP